MSLAHAYLEAPDGLFVLLPSQTVTARERALELVELAALDLGRRPSAADLRAIMRDLDAVRSELAQLSLEAEANQQGRGPP